MAKMQAPQNGVRVRMYRAGHGDCFLLAFPAQDRPDPVYVLIDCGYKPGSAQFLGKIKARNAQGKLVRRARTIEDTRNHIAEATGGYLDLVIITHEHQDHVNGFWKAVDPYFERFAIEQVWLAWTESPTDPLAIDLRARHHDQLLGLVQARNRMAAAGVEALSVSRLDRLLSLEFGGEAEEVKPQALLAAADPSNSVNKQAMKFIKEKAINKNGQNAVQYLLPGEKIWPVPGAAGARAFVLGPPHDADLLADENPLGSEAFPGHAALIQSLTFSAAVAAEAGAEAGAAAEAEAGASGMPFAGQYGLTAEAAKLEPFFQTYYGRENDGLEPPPGREALTNPPWRRIDDEWLYSAENLALKLNTGINNTSLVLAFELPETKKVLLFPGDAQRGNWISWKDCQWQDGQQTITARELLGRTVLYKVGHHGSHNATLAGKASDPNANLAWMGVGAFGGEFTALIPAVNQWALEKNNPPWVHPLPAIKKALEQKAQGRVLQMDAPGAPQKPEDMPDTAWNAFAKNIEWDELFIDVVIEDE